MEARRRAEGGDEEWKPLRRGWCLGGEDFKNKLLEQMGAQFGEHHSGELKRESAAAKAERIIGEELKRLGLTSADLTLRLKSDPEKLRIASRLRTETTLPIHRIAARLHLSVKTVEAHVSSVLRKLQLSSRHELTRWAHERRLI